MISRYGFLSTWCVDAPIDDVWDLLRDSAGYPGWWGAVKTVVPVTPGGPSGLGRVDRFAWHSRLPCTPMRQGARGLAATLGGRLIAQH